MALQVQMPSTSHPQPPAGNPFSSFQTPPAGPWPNQPPSQSFPAAGPTNGSAVANGPASGWNAFHAPAGNPQGSAAASGSGQKAVHAPLQKGPFTASGRFSPPVSLPSSSSGSKPNSPPGQPIGTPAPASGASAAAPSELASCLSFMRLYQLPVNTITTDCCIFWNYRLDIVGILWAGNDSLTIKQPVHQDNRTDAEASGAVDQG